MTICFFGNYLKDYPRVAVMRRGLLENGVEVLECQTRERGIRKYWFLWQLHRQIKNKYDVLMVMMGGQTLVWFAKILTRKKVVFDAFSSLYLTNTEDRQLASKKGIKARIWAFWDWWSCWLADRVLLDTEAQIDYFTEKYKIKRNKFLRVLVSANEEIFYPQAKEKKEDDIFIVHWHGYIVPFYGLETVIKAAEVLKNEKIEFRMITRFNGKYEKIKELTEKMGLKNIKFFPETTWQGVAAAINEADMCLGVFGNNKKARVVISYKVVEALASAKPVIAGRQEVLKELFIDGKNILMCEPENATDLAQRILELKNNRQLREEIGRNGYELYLKKLKPDILIKESLLNIL
jgi:glycosyltransferase involved in cell wall biosynthesis